VTLELFLNLAWLGIACAAYGAFAFWLARQPEGDRDKKLHIALALACGIALLFPIISVTDDLHSDAAALEEVSSARRTSLIDSQPIAVPVMNTAEQIAHELSVCVGVIVVAPPAVAASSFATASSLRAPPRS
jgi:hypothetical protein